MPQNPISYLTVTEGGTTVHNVSGVTLTGSGVTMSRGANPRTVVVDISGGGGGGGSYAEGNGMDFSGADPTTISFSGTLTQASGTLGGAATGGIFLASGDVTNPGTYSIDAYPSGAALYSGSSMVTNPLGQGGGGGVILDGGSARRTNEVGPEYVAGGKFSAGYSNIVGTFLSGGTPVFTGGAAYGIPGDTVASGGMVFYGGSAQGGDTNSAGNFLFQTGSGSTRGGSAVFNLGSGASYGVLIVNPVGDTDPHNLGAIFQSATANLLGNYQLYRSLG